MGEGNGRGLGGGGRWGTGGEGCGGGEGRGQGRETAGQSALGPPLQARLEAHLQVCPSHPLKEVFSCEESPPESVREPLGLGAIQGAGERGLRSVRGVQC